MPRCTPRGCASCGRRAKSGHIPRASPGPAWTALVGVRPHPEEIHVHRRPRPAEGRAPRDPQELPSLREAGDTAYATKGRIVDRIIELLTVHTYIENEVRHPQVRDVLPEVEDDIIESYEEHHVADVLVLELSAMMPDDQRFTAKTTVLIENVEHHMDEEETEWFPQVREGLGRTQLQQLGDQMIRAREKAPRRPSQPGAPKKAVKAVTG